MCGWRRNIGQFRAEYKQQARLGDRICPEVHREKDLCVVCLNNEEGKPYCVTEFQRRTDGPGAGTEKEKTE